MPVEQYRSVLNYDKDKNQIRTKPNRKNARRQLKNCIIRIPDCKT